MSSGFLITGVNPPSKGKVNIGERLACINGKAIVDVLDYIHLSREQNPTLTMADGRTVTVKKAKFDDLGLDFETFLMDNEKGCTNRCVFCFIDQLPKGMRDTLYFKDDDARLSFLMGNYISMTNLSENDVDRIINYRITPLNISVHTTNEELRVKMLGNKKGGSSLDFLRRFAAADIAMNCQIVVCAGLNDGEELTKTLQDLYALSSLDSVAIVPAGLTKFREGLFPLRTMTKEEAMDTLERVLHFGDKLIEKEGRRIIYPSDELFLQAGAPLPSYEFYDDFPQLENGVGMIAMLKDEYSGIERFISPPSKPRKVTGITGVAAFDAVNGIYQDIVQKCEGKLDAKCIAVKNEFFGKDITVTGLVTGTDIINTLKGQSLGDALLVPSVMLRYERDRFLDDITVEELADTLKTPVVVFDTDAASLAEALTGERI